MRFEEKWSGCHPERSEGSAFHANAKEKADPSGKRRLRDDNLSFFLQAERPIAPNTKSGARRGKPLGDAVAISREPAVPPPENSIEAGQAENRVEGPSPPDAAGHIEICIRAGHDLAVARQDPYVVK